MWFKDCIVVRYGEIAIKSKVIRKRFLEKLLFNLRERLKRNGYNPKFLLDCARIIIFCDNLDENFIEIVRKTFGITSLSKGFCTYLKIENIKELALRVAKKYEGRVKTFAIRTQRMNKKFPLNSMEINRIVGEYVKNNTNFSVNLNNPDLEIGIEIGEKYAYVFDNFYYGYGGLPVGSEGKLLSLVSAGVDSALASWYMLKRGCELDFLHFNINNSKEEALNVIKEIFENWGNCYECKVYIINYEKVLEKLSKVIENKYRCIFCKKVMLKIAEKITLEKNYLGIVTGEAIGQVASQTLVNLFFISKDISVPIYRPLAGFDKDEIIKKAKEIGIYDACKKSFRCPFLPERVATKIIPEKYKEIVNKVNFDKIIEDIEIEELTL